MLRTPHDKSSLSTFEIILPQNEITMLTFLFIVDYLTTAHVCFDIPIFRLLCIVHVSHNFIPSVAKWSTNVYCGRNWLVDYILFHVSLENISFIWRTSWRYKNKNRTRECQSAFIHKGLRSGMGSKCQRCCIINYPNTNMLNKRTKSTISNVWTCHFKRRFPWFLW